ncbi:extensin-like [Anoplophora glabripennis]|uniref:extensin-like n=1 Tax=Anoplophora glabripennis TaxID=217634 RepID=UPI000C772E4A|nr:extensin-like [Anoplophora glabripennis]
MHRPAPPGNPVNDDVSSDEEDEMPPPEAAEAEDQGRSTPRPANRASHHPLIKPTSQPGQQPTDHGRVQRLDDDRPPCPLRAYPEATPGPSHARTHANPRASHHPLIKPTSQPGRQPTDHGRVQRLDDDRPPCPLIAYPEATPGPSHARPHANPRASHHPLIKPTSQPGRQPTDHGRVQRLDDDRPPCPLIAYPEATPGPSHARPHANPRASHHPLIKPTSQPGRQPTDHGRVQRLDDDRPPCPLIAYPEATPGPSHARPHANPRASHHPLIKPTSQPGRQPTDHGRVQRLDDDRPPCPLIAYPEATPGPSHARPHAETKPPNQPSPAVGGPTKRPTQHFPGHLDIRRKRRPVRMVAISPPPTKRTQQPRPHERPGTSANPQ